MTEYLVVRLGAERYAVALDAVREVRRPPRTTPLPSVPHWLLGVTNLRGTILAVVDVGQGLGIRSDVAVPEGRAARMVVVRDEETDLAFLVDGVDAVVRAADDDLAGVPDGLPDPLRRYVIATLRDDAGLAAVVAPTFVTGLRDQLGRAS